MVAATLDVAVDGVRDNQPVLERYAQCIPDGKGQSRNGGNMRPAIQWSQGPGGTQSYAIVVVDSDVPMNFDAANKPGKTIPADMPRRNYYHWVQADIPASVTNLAKGASGKVGPGVSGTNSAQGLGYDGPCPPWNDERAHHYHFQVYALDVPSLDLKSGFTAEEAENAMQGHVLARGEVTGIYATNPKVKKTG